MIKIFITDLDGTLIHKSKSHIEPNLENKLAVKKLETNNVKFCIATGRSEDSIRKVEEKLKVSAYKIGVNGATISDVNNNLIHSSYFEKECIEEILKEVEGNFRKDLYYYILMTDKSKNYFRSFSYLSSFINLFYKKRYKTENLKKIHLDDLIGSKERLLKVNLGVNKDKKYKIAEVLEEKINGEICITSPRSIEIGPKNNTKGTAILKLMEILGIDKSEAAYIGDSYNDLSAFKVCEHSFAMSHADENVKKEAKYKVESVSEAVERVLNINNS